ncbi:substrate-binding periplasmic protein [Arsukibacterium sp.]|uniref:substrate-binding periplasmic protein n=1 Tax=Arsukibacterium sp. TaxID=1977258 RepID=UPI002FD9760C
MRVSQAMLFGPLLLLSSFCLVASQASPLRMAMADYPPFSYYAEGGYQGEAYEAFIALMAELEHPYTIRLVPNFGRALNDLQQDSIDGFFLASESAERNQLAVFSEPVLTTVWSWVWLCDRADLDPATAAFKQQARIAAQTNSNIYRWLQQQGYQTLSGTQDIRGLFALLDHHRVDAVMMPQDTAELLISQQQHQQPRYRLLMQQQQPFGIYLDKNFVAKYPDFMPRLNQAIKQWRAEHLTYPTKPAQTKCL